MRKVLTLAFLCFAATSATAAAAHYSAWATAQKTDEIGGNSSELNTPFLDGCPIQSPDGLSLYLASNRPGGHGGLDIWVARRTDVGLPFGAPEDLPAPINSTADDFCPTPLRGGGLFFVSRRLSEASCGLGDIYFSRENPPHRWSEPSHLPCAPNGPNSALDEQGPSYVATTGQLYFSRNSGTMAGDIFISNGTPDTGFGPASAVGELNSGANDIQPNVRKDGLEIVFSSNREGGAGGQDIWTSSRSSTAEPWSPPADVGPAVNTAASETRPSFSWDAQQLLFGRTPGPEGISDIYLSARVRLRGGE
jgi:WD40-like Beta Propeller Repeat